MTYTMDRDKDKRTGRRPDVMKRLNAENLLMIERGLFGDLPQKLNPKPYVPVRGRPTDLVVAKPSGLLSSCLPVIPDSPGSEKLTPSDDENVSPLKKTFSFRDKFSRLSIFGRDKDKSEKPKWKTIAEDEKREPSRKSPPKKEEKKEEKIEHEKKVNKRFWFFRNKEMQAYREKRKHIPVYKRSKSFECLPKAEEEEFQEEDLAKNKNFHKNRQSFIFGSDESFEDIWPRNDSLEYISNVYYDNDDTVFLKSVKELEPSSSNNNSSMSTVTSASSGIVINIFKRESVQDLLDEFDRTVDMFRENYLSDSEPYTKTGEKDLPLAEKRKSSSFSTLPSPKVVQVTKASEMSEDFKKELSRVLSEKRGSYVRGVKTTRRGSVTDWFVLEDKVAAAAASTAESNKYRKGQKKSINRVRRMSSTKYVSI